jgi:hypothetical protein
MFNKVIGLRALMKNNSRGAGARLIGHAYGSALDPLVTQMVQGVDERPKTRYDTYMNKLLSALAVLALAAPAHAREIVNPDELMVVVPGLEFVGPSRISTVEHCAEIEGLGDYRQLITDHDFEAMHACLVEHT